MRERDEPLDERLDDALDGIKDAAREILREGAALDPDRVAEQLSSLTDDTSSVLERLMADVTPNPDEITASGTWPVTFAAVLRNAVDDALSQHEQLVVASTSSSIEGALRTESARRIRAALTRTVSLGLRFAGAGGQLEVAASSDAGTARVVVRATHAGQLDPDASHPDAETVRDFVRDLDGELELRVNGPQVELSVELRGALVR